MPFGRRRSLLILATAWLVASPARSDDAVGPIDLGTEPVFTHGSPIGTISYTPGRGLALGDTGLNLGGYLNTTLERNEGDPAVFDLDDVSFLLLWRLAPRLHVFSELEVEHAFQLDDEGHAGNPDDRFTVERLYGDLTLADALTLRAGVYLTPVGRWNLIHAAPLVWTTSRPLVTERPFNPNSTGVMAYGSFFPDGGLINYSVYGQFADPIEGNPDFVPDDDSAGGRVEFVPSQDLSVGASYRAAERDGRWRHLGGLDLFWHWQRLELLSEAVVGNGSPSSTEWGFYVQASIELVPHVYLVERVEHYDPPNNPPVNLIASGFLFRLLSNTVLKLEYLAADTNDQGTDPGLKAAVAVLF